MKTINERGMYRVLGFSDKGKVRLENQDNYLILNRDDTCLAAVADGIGGLAGGAEASRILMQWLADWWRRSERKFLADGGDLSEIEQSLEECIAEINKVLLAKSAKMGSTLSLLLLYRNQYLIKHVGDSRIYFLRDFGLEQLTHDHTWYEQEKLKQPDKQLAQNKMSNVLVNAIGVKEDFFLETAKGDLRNVLIIMLCTDGVYKYFTFDTIEQFLAKKDSISEKAAYLQQILQGTTAADNYTAVILCLPNSLKRGWRFDL